MGLDLIQESQRAIGLLAEDVEDGLFYMDDGAGESFHFSGGLPTLLELGARGICSLENASVLDAAVSWRGPSQDPVEKIVILTSKLLIDSHSEFLRVLRMHRSVKKCTIWTSVSEEAHGAHPDTSFGLGAFHDYKNSLLRDLSASTLQPGGRFDEYESTHRELHDWQVSDIEIKFFPMMICSFTNSLFVLPSGGAVAQAPLSSYQDAYALSRGLPGVDVEEPVPAGAVLLAHCLQHVVAQLDLKPEIFTLGPLANVVGKMMAGLPTPSDGAGHTRQPVGLVLIDRTLDIVTPSTHGDSLLDRCFSSLPRRPPPNTSSKLRSSVITSTVVRPPMDVRIMVDSDEAKPSDYTKVGVSFPSRPILPNWAASIGTGSRSAKSGGASAGPLSHNENLKDGSDLWGGSLSSSWDKRGYEYLETLVGKRTKDSLLQVRKWLQEALRQEKISNSGKGRLSAVSVNDLRLSRSALSQKPEVAMRNTALVQLTRAAEEALSGDSATLWDSLMSSEKILMLTAGDVTQSLALQLRDIVQQCAQNIRRAQETQTPLPSDILSLRDALTLAIVAYGLAGEGLLGMSHGSPFSWEEERALRDAVIEAVMKGPVGAPLGFLKSLESDLAKIWSGDETKKEPEVKKVEKRNQQVDDDWDRWEGVDEDEEDTEDYTQVRVKAELRDRLGEVFANLHKVAAGCGRSLLRDVPLPVESQITAGAALHRGLIFKVLSLAFAKMDIPGLEYHASGMTRFLKGGFGRFALRQAKPKLSDQRVLLVFVIGGLNFVEVRDAREAQAAIPGAEKCELLLGGTTLLTPSDMYDLLIGSCGGS
ncbi:hypothetical protein R1flu_006676 [Riccia fluitans]|uniref:Sec1 family domain-containing protein MIP3 n=1 Tax=Riccia fluitans TaxID=41844 RepID=A0ABD1Z0S1_9MARC